jgi:putative tryptophan/tyrosine transport system substrate-binding protein
MRRRDALVLVAAWSAAVTPLALLAQPSRRIYRIGAPMIAPQHTIQELLTAFEKGLREHGFVPGENVEIHYRFADNAIARLPEFYQEMVRANVDVIMTGVNPQTAAARQATKTIPIVMAVGQDVIGQGFVASYARPGGNITGLTWEMGAGPTAKRLEYLREVAPGISRLAVIFDPPFGDQDFSLRRSIEDAARTLNWTLSWTDITDDFQRGFTTTLRHRPDALVWLGHARQRSRRAEAVALTTKYRLPASYHDPAFVDAGGLMSYGPNVHDLFWRAGGYVSRILKGAKPADLPVEQPSKFELVLNVKSARALDLSFPQSLLLRADRVIE